MNMSKKSSEEAIELMSCTEVEAEEEEVSKPHKRNHQKPHSIDIPEVTVEANGDKASSQDVSVKIGKILEKSTRKLAPDPHGPMDCDCSDVFIQMLELSSNGSFWSEKARWIKYEENVEPSGNWGRPFLPYIECESLRQFGYCLENGLVLLGSENEGAYNLSHTISNMLVLGGYAEPQYRSKIQQILTVPRMHQGESTARFRKKMNLRRKVLTMAEQTRKEVMARAWDLSDNEVRNRWVRLAREALNRRQKLNPDAQHMKGHQENCPEKYFFDENSRFETMADSNLLSSHSTFDGVSVGSEFSDTLFFVNEDFDAVQERGMTREQEKLRKIIHPNSKGILILHASVDFLKRDKFLSALVRFKNDKPLVDSMEISLPVRFVYLLITSKHNVRLDGYQVCRAAATLFKDKTFRRDALQAKTLADITKASLMFVDGTVMLPPGIWQPELLIPVAEAISKITRKKHLMQKFKHRDGKHLWRIVRTKVFVISMMKELLHGKELQGDGYVETEVAPQEETMTPTYFPRRGDCKMKTKLCKRRRRLTSLKTDVNIDDSQNSDSSVSDDEEGSNEIHPLQPDGRWFGGLRRELVKRYPIYWSDIKDGLSIQCVASLFYLAISLTAMCLTYGQVIAKYTKDYMGASEMLLATAISCCVMAVFATEPSSVIAGTAAMLIIESSTYQASDSWGLEFFQFRWITGIWIFLFLVLILAFDKTHWIRYCTRFTEEILHVLVALLFMYEGFKNLGKVYDKYPLRKDYVITNSKGQNSSTVADTEKPNTALLYTIVMFATFGIALGFRLFEKTRFFSPRIRRLLNFFSIAVAVNVMNLMMYFVDVYLNTIHIPEGLLLTSPRERDHLVFLDVQKIANGQFSYWIILLAAIPALLTVIILFIESEITLLECFKETKGRKGSGFHVNLLIVAVMVLVSSFLGLPWMCLAAVETSVHLDSLKVWSSFDAPGVKSHVVKIKEQRLTLFFTGILVGLAGVFNSYLDHIPEAVFSGMVLYMGVVALFGVQLVERFFLMFMAPGQHPDIPYLKNVPLLKVYSFTVIQIVCVVGLWVVKSFKVLSPFFPLVVLLMIPFRALLGKVFSANHIEQLDDEEEEEGHGPLD